MRQSEIQEGKTCIGPRGAPKRARSVVSIQADHMGIVYVTVSGRRSILVPGD